MSSIGNPYVPEVALFSKTKEFTYLADFFRANQCYTNLPEGTIQYQEFWKEIKDKCIYGMTNSVGIKITGIHFFYLNFCPIERQTTDSRGRISKSMDFPSFVDLDYDYFWMVDYCRMNGKNLEGVKGRRQGWSYRAAALCMHEFYFYPDSRSIIGAFLGTFSETTMGFGLNYSNHINSYTEFRKNRAPDLKDYIMARYQVTIGGVKVWKGYKSSVEMITFKDKATAAVGKSASWFILDEAGVFPNIINTYGYSEPLIKDGSTWTGSAIIFGSSGDMENGCQYFYEMFTNPRKYNCLEFPDPENPQIVIGYFSTAIRGRWGVCKNPNSKWYNLPMVDEDGNSNEEAAYDDIMYERIQAKSGNDHKALHNKITQYPLTYKEAFLRNKGAIFASPEMLEWLGKVETLPSLRGEGQAGTLGFDSEGKLKWKPDGTLEPITDFPVKAEHKTDGCIVTWELPERVGGNEDNPGEIPYGLYIAGCDPYDQDKAETSTSLGSFFIYKRFYQADKTHDVIVAEYTGRPERADDFYENCRKLCMFYNARCLYENNLKGLKGYFENKNSLQYLYETPGIVKDFIKDSRVKRMYGIHMSQQIKDQCEIYLKQWLYDERSGPDGTKFLNLHTIKSIPLLKELIAYDKDGNFDRVIAFMLCILQKQEVHRQYVQDNMSIRTKTGDYLEKIYSKSKLNINNKKSYTPFR